MHPEIKRAWVEALQTTHLCRTYLHVETLTGEHQFSPLGVLCNLYSSQMKRGAWEVTPARQFHQSENSFYQQWFAFVVSNPPSLEDYYFLPDEVAEWTELTTQQQVNINLNNDDDEVELGDFIDWIKETF